MTYCTIQDIRDEGFSSSQYPDSRVTAAIALAGQTIDQATNRWFEPRTLDFRLDGTGTEILRLEFPIIEITEIRVEDTPMSTDDYFVYNRHVTQNLTYPDDRNEPRIELDRGTTFEYYGSYYGTRARYGYPYPRSWPIAQQNIRVQGVFGYTDYDSGNTQGVTPEGIRRLCILLTLPELDQKSDPSSSEEFSRRWSLSEIKTRDQTFKFGGVTTPLTRLVSGSLTGNPEIDRLILFYRRPPRIGAV